MKTLITGHNGQLGTALLACHTGRFDVRGVDLPDVDIAEIDSVRRVCADLRPELIINAAAYTAVDGAEDQPALAHRVNADGARNVAEAARECGARLIHISTDFVFDGKQSSPYQPEDETSPLNVYGASKAAGERQVREILAERSIIVRTAWLYGAVGSNFVHTILRLLSEKTELSVVADQIGTPTWATSLAEAVWAFAAESKLSGIYHWTDAGAASWYDFAVAIQEEALALKLIRQSIPVLPVTTEQYPTPAVRPAYSVLNKKSAYRDLDITPVHWRVNLRKMLQELELSK